MRVERESAIEEGSGLRLGHPFAPGVSFSPHCVGRRSAAEDNIEATDDNVVFSWVVWWADGVAFEDVAAACEDNEEGAFCTAQVRAGGRNVLASGLAATRRAAEAWTVRRGAAVFRLEADLAVRYDAPEESGYVAAAPPPDPARRRAATWPETTRGSSFAQGADTVDLWALDRLDGPVVASPTGWSASRLPENEDSVVALGASRLDGAFSQSAVGSGVYIYVVDSGVRRDHDEFSDGSGGTRVTDLYCALFSSDLAAGVVNPCDDSWEGHGTLVASAAAGLRTGVAPGALVRNVKAVGANGDSSILVFTAALGAILDEHPAGQPGVVNMSIAFPGSLATEGRLVNLLADAGVVSVIAAGNDGLDACEYAYPPYTTALVVGGSDREDKVRAASNIGPCVDLFAPGVDVWGACGDRVKCPGSDRFAKKTGTSFASPLVAGLVAVHMSAHPNVGAYAARRAVVRAAGSAVRGHTPPPTGSSGYLADWSTSKWVWPSAAGARAPALTTRLALVGDMKCAAGEDTGGPCVNIPARLDRGILTVSVTAGALTSSSGTVYVEDGGATSWTVSVGLSVGAADHDIDMPVTLRATLAPRSWDDRRSDGDAFDDPGLAFLDGNGASIGTSVEVVHSGAVGETVSLRVGNLGDILGGGKIRGPIAGGAGPVAFLDLLTSSANSLLDGGLRSVAFVDRRAPLGSSASRPVVLDGTLAAALPAMTPTTATPWPVSSAQAYVYEVADLALALPGSDAGPSPSACPARAVQTGHAAASSLDAALDPPAGPDVWFALSATTGCPDNLDECSVIIDTCRSAALFPTGLTVFSGRPGACDLGRTDAFDPPGLPTGDDDPDWAVVEQSCGIEMAWRDADGGASVDLGAPVAYLSTSRPGCRDPTTGRALGAAVRVRLVPELWYLVRVSTWQTADPGEVTRRACGDRCEGGYAPPYAAGRLELAVRASLDGQVAVLQSGACEDESSALFVGVTGALLAVMAVMAAAAVV